MFTSQSCKNGNEMYKKAWCTCEVVVLLIKPIVFLTFSLSSALLDLKVPIIISTVVVVVIFITDDDDNNNNVIKQLVLWAKQQLCTCITLFSTFLWRPLHDYDVKPPKATFYGGRGHTTTNFPSSIWTWIKPLRIQLQEKSPAFDELNGSKWTR